MRKRHLHLSHFFQTAAHLLHDVQVDIAHEAGTPERSASSASATFRTVIG
jgi:hypothetical protein